MEIFDDEWIAAAAQALASLPAAEGVDLVIDHVISGAPAGKVTLSATLVDGQVTDLAAVKSAAPDLVVSLKFDVVRAVLSGELSSDAAYMNGALKVEGAHERWMLDLRPARLALPELLAPVMVGGAAE